MRITFQAKLITLGIAMGLNCQLFAQDGSDKTKAKDEPVLDTAYVPEVILGAFIENYRTSQLIVDPADAKVKLTGRIMGDTASRFILGMQASAESENSIASIFNGTKITPKATLGLTAGWTISNVVKYDFEVKNQIKVFNYDSIIKNQKSLLNVHKHKALFFGVSGEGAKYHLVDSTKKSFDSIVYENKYAGWEAFLQYMSMTYYFKHDLLLLRTIRVGYGEENNVEDLDEYNISRSFAITQGTSKQSFDFKRTGYIGSEYKRGHFASIALETGLYPTPDSKMKVGYLLGTDFQYHERSKNELRFHVGFTFLASNKEKEIFYASIIIRNSGIFNINNDPEFDVRQNFSGFIRLSRTLNWKPRKNNQAEKIDKQKTEATKEK